MPTPVPQTGRRWITGCAMALGALALFGAGILLGRQNGGADRPTEPSRAASRPSAKALVRNVFSPTVVADPYVLDEQRKVADALDRSCRLQNDHCDTARKARAYLDSRR